MKMYLFLLIFPLLGFTQDSLQERLEKASKKVKKPARKLEQNHEGIQNNSHLNGKIFEKLLNDQNISQEQVQQTMIEEINYLTTCLKQNNLSYWDQHWIQEILKIAEKLKEPYFIDEGIYDVIECSNQIGLTRYSVEVKRDPENPGQLFIYNFYNSGKKFKINANQTGSRIEIKPQTYNSSHAESLVQYSNSEAKKQYDKDFESRNNKSTAYDCPEYKSEVYPNGNFNMAIRINDGSSIDHCSLSFVKQTEKKLDIKPYQPSGNNF